MRQNNKNTLLQMALLCFLGVTSCNNNSKITYTATQRESDFDKGSK